MLRIKLDLGDVKLTVIGSKGAPLDDVVSAVQTLLRTLQEAEEAEEASKEPESTGMYL